MKLNSQERAQILEESVEPSTGPVGFNRLLLRVLCSIDERLADTNDFYLQNQEERNRPNG